MHVNAISYNNPKILNNNIAKQKNFNGAHGLKAGTVLGIIPSSVATCVSGAEATSIKSLVMGVIAGILVSGLMGYILEELTKDNNNDDQNPPINGLDFQG